MRRQLPPLNALKTFEASARTGGFLSAAAELGVSPAAVSQQVKNLERFFGKIGCMQHVAIVGGQMPVDRSGAARDVDHGRARRKAFEGLAPERFERRVLAAAGIDEDFAASAFLLPILGPALA